MLAYGKDVAVRIFEPCYLVAVGRGPDSEFAVLHKGILLESNALFPEPSGHRLDVRHLPAEDSTLQGGEIRQLGNADHVPSGVHDQRVLIQAHKLKSKLIFIKGTRLVVIARGNEPYDLSRSEHGFRPHRLPLTT